MGLWDKLREASSYLRKLRLSRGPDSYFQYKREQNYERQQEEHARDRTKDSAERKREKDEREREHEERYKREHEGDTAREWTERAEEMGPDR